MLDDQAVAQYLRENPEFFVRHGKLLAELRLPHRSGAAISLIERQVSLLREQNQRYQYQLQELIEIARDNDRLNEHMQSLSLRFMESDDINEALVLLNLALCNDFSADAVTLFVMMDEDQLLLQRDGLDPLEVICLGRHVVLRGFEDVVATGEPRCGQFDHDQRDALFGAHANIISSAVVIPLYYGSFDGQQPLGLLAIGSQQQDRYHAEMGTIFLKYLAELLSRRLRSYYRA
jgi:uncharacterized protein YigA (DUF484 family)